MKLWVDDVRPAPEGYVWVRSVEEAKQVVLLSEREYQRILDLVEIEEIEIYKIGWCKIANQWQIELINLDHDAGDYAHDGGDYIKLLDWLEETGRNYPIRIHSQNPVGIANMRRIIQRNGWKEVF